MNLTGNMSISHKHTYVCTYIYIYTINRFYLGYTIYMFNKWIRLPLNSPKNHPTRNPGVSPSIASGRPRLGAARGALRSPSTTAAVDAPGTAAWQRRGFMPGMSIRFNGYFNWYNWGYHGSIMVYMLRVSKNMIDFREPVPKRQRG